MATDAPRLDDLIALVRERAPDEPIEQLREAATLKTDIDELTDSLLGHFVDQARRAGCSWSQIGEALGVTKQAAQQKHTSVESTARRLLSAISPSWAPREGYLKRFTTRARAVVVAAHDAAVGFNHDFVGTEHVLLALFSDPEAVAAKVLDELGVDRAEVLAQVMERVPPGDEPVAGHIPFTPRAKKVLELALREALQLGHNYIGTEHILLGLIREQKGLAGEVLRDAGVEYGPAAAAIVRHLTGGSSTG